MKKHYSSLINLCFITLLAYLGTQAFYKTLAAQMDVYPLPVSPPRQGPALAQETRRPLSDYSTVEKRNLFDTPAQAGAVPPPTLPEPDTNTTEDLQLTALKIRLWGTVTGDPSRACAVIEDSKKRKQNLYRQGDTIQGATIKKILREEVILNVNGKDEKLTMAKADSKSGGRPSPGSPFPGKRRSSDAKKIDLKRAEIDAAMKDVNQLMKQARIRPHFKNGKADGLTLSRVKRNSLFTKLGLKSGDIITGVDGQDIKSVDDALKFYNNLKSSSNVKVQIRRRGSLQDIEYEIE
ncbi:type II secretion system protein GspC [Desulfonema ishimotonii]|uniref:Type II secretion system protein GspC n=2 Tax=Desulfonema ishimotonii TaxID=45657 RepID=A0A401G491_9BACT|nr:type II secretion system protein GspC [Desulfonema ishimotonii]